MTHSRRASLLIFLVTAFACTGCDQLTKDIARARLSGVAATSMAFGAIQLELVENPGAFLSFGASFPEAVRRGAFLFGVPLLLIFLCVAILPHRSLTQLDAFSLALVVGGGLGNWLDRIFNDGRVTDFVSVGWGPLRTGIFNAADVIILAGIALLFMSQWNSFREDQPEPGQ